MTARILPSPRDHPRSHDFDVLSHSQDSSPIKNPNLIRLGPRQQHQRPHIALDTTPPSNYYSTPHRRSRSPLRPVQPIDIHEDGELPDESWAADKEELYNQIEKLTLRLDTAYASVSSQKARITDLEEQLRSKTELVDQYQKRLRKELATVEEKLKSREKSTEQCERFKKEIVRLSHEIHYLRSASDQSVDQGVLRVKYVKMRRERDLVRDELAKELARNGRSIIGWPTAEKRVMNHKYDS